MEELQFDEKGLIPAIIQDAATAEVLMLGFMNRESLQRTIESGEVWFYSRGRQKLWKKGETSGNVINLVNIKYNCENNSLLVAGNPTGPVCHTGHKTCFYRDLTIDKPKQDRKR